MQSIINATHAMSTSGYTTMSAITTKMHKLLLYWSKLNVTGFTIFAPIESAFTCDNVSGCTEATHFETVLLHYSPVYLPHGTLRFIMEIPTISIHEIEIEIESLTVTSFFGDSDIEIESVKVSLPPIYDDGCVIVYSIEQIFVINYINRKIVVHTKSSSNGRIPRDPEL
ncbi:hypothetical protein RND71_002667 [Anisodus tanguticus]|uniref:Uncharacterized protein n=1 Tax=Anisodus tanguticus TaxID=243964 RepID=A0AAE1SXA5_9SOLA|nr:hypothetical protein RND71_002667 [Anisodus tanguticus]